MRQSSCHKTETIKKDPVSHISPKIITQTITRTTTTKAKLKPPPPLPASLLAPHQHGLQEDKEHHNRPPPHSPFPHTKWTPLETPKQKLKTERFLCTQISIIWLFSLAIMYIFWPPRLFLLLLLLFFLLNLSLAIPQMEVPLSGSLPYPKLGPGPVGW